jgi:hypothetical protein
MRSLFEDLRLQSSKIEALSEAARFPADSKRLSQELLCSSLFAGKEIHPLCIMALCTSETCFINDKQ